MAPQALLIEDDRASLDALAEVVQAQGFETVAVQSLEQAREHIARQSPELAVLDLDLPDGHGGDLLDELHSGFDTEVVVVTGHGTIDSAVEALHSGVVDYFTKPLDLKRFERVLANVRRTLDLRKEVSALRENLRRHGRFHRLVGASPAIQEVFDLVSRVASTSSTVLLVGETGTGKDLVAEAVHALSRRSTKPFVAVNCGAVQPTLIESELFGHEAGSFTGANRVRKGVFEQANGGTLFLDEITEMPLDLQVKLLRVLETRVIQRVGGEKPIQVDVRLVAATNRSPEKAVEQGKLREDLFYRLKVFPIRVPPLRVREGDVELLAGHFLKQLNDEGGSSKRLDASALDALRRHDWPGNVRELRNVIERANILAGDEVSAEHLQLERSGRAAPTGDQAISIEVGTSIAEAEKRMILATLARMDGNKQQAAEVLGICLKTLYNRLNSYGIGRSKLKVAASA